MVDVHEKLNAKKYLLIDRGEIKKQFFGNVFTTTITNSASMNSFTDVVVGIDYYGKEGELVSSNLIELNYKVVKGILPIVFDAPKHPQMVDYKFRIISAQAE